MSVNAPCVLYILGLFYNRKVAFLFAFAFCVFAIGAKDECPSGLRSTPRKRVRATPSASSNLASSASRVSGD